MAAAAHPPETVCGLPRRPPQTTASAPVHHVRRLEPTVLKGGVACIVTADSWLKVCDESSEVRVLVNTCGDATRPIFCLRVPKPGFVQFLSLKVILRKRETMSRE